MDNGPGGLARNGGAVQTIGRLAEGRLREGSGSIDTVEEAGGSDAIGVADGRGERDGFACFRDCRGVDLERKGGAGVFRIDRIAGSGSAAGRGEVEEDGFGNFVVIEFRMQPWAAAQPFGPQRDRIFPVVDDRDDRGAILEGRFQQIVHVEEGTGSPQVESRISAHIRDG